MAAMRIARVLPPTPDMPTSLELPLRLLRPLPDAVSSTPMVPPPVPSSLKRRRWRNGGGVLAPCWRARASVTGEGGMAVSGKSCDDDEGGLAPRSMADEALPLRLRVERNMLAECGGGRRSASPAAGDMLIMSSPLGVAVPPPRWCWWCWWWCWCAPSPSSSQVIVMGTSWPSVDILRPNAAPPWP